MILGRRQREWLSGTAPKNAAEVVWKEIPKPSPEKRAACVFRWIGIFVSNIKNAARLGKKVNLAVHAHSMRDKKDIGPAYEMAALFTHFAL